MFASHSLVKYEFTSTKKLVKKLAELRQALFVADSLPMCLPTVFALFTHQLEFANMSLPT